jgi:hypothetical protein
LARSSTSIRRSSAVPLDFRVAKTFYLFKALSKCGRLGFESPARKALSNSPVWGAAEFQIQGRILG